MLLEEPKELFHYTGIAGLKGILESQTLWATHYKYLNDEREIEHFRLRLLEILKPIFHEKVEETVGKVYRILFGDDSTPPLVEPYITSFCTTKNADIEEHGLLSQWRGYGQNGGYAVVFDALALKKLLGEENEKWAYCPLNGGDVVYSKDKEEEIQSKTCDHEKLKEAFINFFESSEPTEKLLGKTYDPTVTAACRFKHWGFKEEEEFRIVAVRRQQGDYLKKKPIKHFLRSDTVVPYLNLLEDITSLPKKKTLSIKRIIIGPHREKEKRKREIKILLNHLGLHADVSVSEIPYLG